ncbi:hypothetical protein MSG28_010407 [Choristoneura fumiferana]|uniref:Uncharacterized protein n=1 Tax=Choristoneura fumiferana TaxID=7141 RepID=A0ACC0KL75_CHOFU|nr:hypothetical protein MSG28_010407 [Choristoneura fumiferana]
MRVLCRPKKSQIEMYWTKLREVYNTYFERFHPIMSHYNSLREKDDFYQRDIARNELQIQQASELLLNLQKEYKKSTNAMAAKLNRMGSHREELAKKYWQMKKDSKNERSRTEEYLAVMVDASQDATKLAKICSKYEIDGDNDVMRSETGDSRIPDYEYLDGAMITMCLRAEKNKLTAENVQLKHYIKRYLTELALKGHKGRPFSVALQSKTQKVDAAGKVL